MLMKLSMRSFVHTYATWGGKHEKELTYPLS